MIVRKKVRRRNIRGLLSCKKPPRIYPRRAPAKGRKKVGQPERTRSRQNWGRSGGEAVRKCTFRKKEARSRKNARKMRTPFQQDAVEQAGGNGRGLASGERSRRTSKNVPLRGGQRTLGKRWWPQEIVP